VDSVSWNALARRKVICNVVEECLCQHLGRGFGILKGNDSIPVGFFEGFKHRVLGVHAEGMVEGVQIVADGIFHDFEVADHAMGIEFIGLDNDFYLATVPVWKTALVRVVREHVPVFDFDGFADAKGHGFRFLGCFRKDVYEVGRKSETHFLYKNR